MRFSRFSQASYSVIWFAIVIVVISSSIGVFYMSVGKHLNQQAYTTTESAKERLQYGITIISMLGTDGSDKTLEQFIITFRLAPNSRVMLFDDMYFTVYSNNFSHHYIYNQSINCSDLSTYPYTAGYGIELPFTAKSHQQNIMLNGDVGRICIQTPESIPDNTLFDMEMILGKTTMSSFSVRFPRGIIHQTENLFP